MTIYHLMTLKDWETYAKTLNVNSQGIGNNEVLISFHFDSTLPTPTFAANITSPTNNSNLNAVLIFNEDVNGSLENGLSLINCSIDSLGRTDSSYTFEINPVGTGNVSLITNRGAFFDPAGNSNFSSDTLTFYYDNLPPDVNIVTPVQNKELEFTVKIPKDKPLKGYYLILIRSYF